jgi:hypothetical protein
VPVRPAAATSSAESEPQFVPLQGPVATLLARLESGWQPTAFVLPPVLTVTGGGTDWTEHVVTVRIVGRELHLRLAGTAAAQAAVSLRDWEASTEGGGQLTGHVATSTTEFGLGMEHEVVFQCEEWAFTPAVVPVLWAARLQDVYKAPGPGNLHIRSQQGDRVYTSTSHLRLERPGLIAYLLETRERADEKALWLSFDGQANPAAWPLLGKNLGLLRALLAMPIRPGLFFGLADDGRTVAARTVANDEAARDVATGTKSLVPLTYPETLGRQVWVAPFYRRLYEHFALNGLVSFSFSRYTHTLSQFDTDTQFELVAGSVAVLIKELATRPDASPALKALLRQAARRSKRLTGRPDAPAIPPNTTSPNAPPAYPAGWQLRLERQMLTELAGEVGELVAADLLKARQVFEYGSLSTAQDYVDTPGLGFQNFERLLRLRRTYALLLARAIDYHGLVNRFEVLRAAPLEEPATQPETMQEASTYYLVKEDLSGLSVWPTFALPSLPDSPLIQQFVTFAERIRQLTAGRVVARLRPLPQKASDPLHLSFRLLVNNVPSTQVALFTLEVVADGLVVRGWHGEPLRITKEADLTQFTAQLVASDEFSLQVQRLLLLEQDIYRGEA